MKTQHIGTTLVLAIAMAVFSCGSAGVQAQLLMMPDSTNNRLVTFDANDGSVVNTNVFPLLGGTPIHAMLVGSEIWVSEQIGDRVSRFDLTGNVLGQLGTAGLDNVRGMGQFGGKVYVTSTGTANGAPGRQVRMYDTAGNELGFFLTPLSSGFHVLPHQGGLLVSSDSANDDIHRYDLSGNSLGAFHNSTGLNFAEQMDYATNGDILVAAFSSNLVVRLDPNTGTILGSFAASGARGVKQLGNGNILWTNSAGAHVYNVGTGTSTQVYAGGGRFIDVIPEPTTASLLALAGFALIRRRR